MKKGFTLSEVLITLGVIGIVAALTIPSMVAKHKEKVLLNQFKKTYSVLNNAYAKTVADLGYTPDCFSWDRYYANCTPKCFTYDEIGNCTDNRCSDGSSFPPGLNGSSNDCAEFRTEFFKKLKIVKSCPTNGYANGCTHDIMGTDDVSLESNPDKTPLNSHFNKNKIRTQPSYILADGSVIIDFISSGSGWPGMFLVDINGKKGPNKPGYDVFSLGIISDSRRNIKITSPRANIGTAKGGYTTLQMLERMGN